MKTLAITSKGIEKECKEEIEEILNVKAEEIERGVLFEVKEAKDAAKACYLSQCAERVIIVCSETEIKENLWKDIREDIVKNKEEFFSHMKNKSFEARCECFNEKLRKDEIEENLGGIFHDELDCKVDLSKPEITVVGFFNSNKAFVGIDLSGKHLQKRDYKIFVNKESLRASIAAAMVRMADIKDDSKIIDPYCKSGEIVIEAALKFMKKSVNFYNKDRFRFLNIEGFKDVDVEIYDKEMHENIKAEIIGSDKLMNNVNASKKNAKIAGIEKKVRFTRIDAEWLDTKFKEKEIDAIITRIPEMSKLKSTKDVVKEYNELFYQAEYVLGKKGKIVLICKRNNKEIEKVAKEKKFVVKEKRDVWMGQEEMKILVIVKG